jgi:hypothetical protein
MIDITELSAAVHAAILALIEVEAIATRLGDDDSEAGIAISELADLVEEFQETLRDRFDAIEDGLEEAAQ